MNRKAKKAPDPFAWRNQLSRTACPICSQPTKPRQTILARNADTGAVGPLDPSAATYAVMQLGTAFPTREFMTHVKRVLTRSGEEIPGTSLLLLASHLAVCSKTRAIDPDLRMPSWLRAHACEKCDRPMIKIPDRYGQRIPLDCASRVFVLRKPDGFDQALMRGAACEQLQARFAAIWMNDVARFEFNSGKSATPAELTFLVTHFATCPSASFFSRKGDRWKH